MDQYQRHSVSVKGYSPLAQLRGIARAYSELEGVLGRETSVDFDDKALAAKVTSLAKIHDENGLVLAKEYIDFHMRYNSEHDEVDIEPRHEITMPRQPKHINAVLSAARTWAAFHRSKGKEVYVVPIKNKERIKIVIVKDRLEQEGVRKVYTENHVFFYSVKNKSGWLKDKYDELVAEESIVPLPL